MNCKYLRPSGLVLLVVLLAVLIESCGPSYVYMSEGVYYVDSQDGSDDSNGLSPSTAWRSLEKVSYSIVAPGSSVLFKSGQIFRGTLTPSSGTTSKRVNYGSYGDDSGPILQNSIDLSQSSKWKQSETGIWKADLSFKDDVGNIIFDGDICGVRKWSRSELTAPLDFYFDRFWKTLRVKSSRNPAEIYSLVEAALTRHIVDQSNVSYASFTNLHFRYGGAHGFGGGSTRGLRITDCEFSFIGGGFLYEKDGRPVRYGNGIEFWGDASDNLVENCYLHDIYDTGVTNQNHTTSAVQKNIIYRNNIIENCGLASFEFWNRPASSSMTNIVFENNTSINPGMGWGVQRPDLHGSHVSVFGNESSLEGIIIRKNIFYGGNIIYFFDQGTYASAAVSADYNCLYPIEDGSYDYLCLVWDNNSVETSTKYGAGALAVLQSASGRENNSVSADPQFLSPEYPYTLSAGSSCVGLGISGY